MGGGAARARREAYSNGTLSRSSPGRRGDRPMPNVVKMRAEPQGPAAAAWGSPTVWLARAQGISSGMSQGRVSPALRRRSNTKDSAQQPMGGAAQETGQWERAWQLPEEAKCPRNAGGVRRFLGNIARMLVSTSPIAVNCSNAQHQTPAEASVQH
ncbi:hypothetical protein VTK56DRAFT_3227 [Thermocarpiscus australiensis]